MCYLDRPDVTLSSVTLIDRMLFQLCGEIPGCDSASEYFTSAMHCELVSRLLDARADLDFIGVSRLSGASGHLIYMPQMQYQRHEAKLGF